jgi:hypothetical protein
MFKKIVLLIIKGEILMWAIFGAVALMIYLVSSFL